MKRPFSAPVRLASLAALAAVAMIGAAQGQGLPVVGPVVDRVIDGVVQPTLDNVADTSGAVLRSVDRLAKSRVDRLTGIVQNNRAALEFDDHGDPAVRSEIIGTPASDISLDAARKAGFTILADEKIEGLGIRNVVMRVPKGMALPRALKLLRKTAPGEWSANQIHFESGGAPAIPMQMLAPSATTTNPRIGMIDGGVADHPLIGGSVEQRGFVAGAPSGSSHGTAIAALVRGVLPGCALLAADVYGKDPAGGNALAIARAIGWLAQRNTPVVTISLVGPANPLLARVISAGQARGMIFVAAVGNDGPAAPPVYPASYSGVIAVTGVDGRNRVLIEAGRALHLDYAAPGADILGAAPGGGMIALRGTSYAAPLAAARLAAHYTALAPARRPATLLALDAEARDLGKQGNDKIYGRGLLCGGCAARAR